MPEKFYEYEFRFTYYDSETLENSPTDLIHEFLQAFLESYDESGYICGQEYAINHHYHIYMKCPEKIDSKIFRDELYDFMKTPKSKQGNPTYKFGEVRTIEYLSYCVKDGNYTFSENMAEIAKLAYEQSYEKPQGLTRDTKKLLQSYAEGDLTDKQLWIQLVKTRSVYNAEIYFSKINALVRSARINKCPSLVDSYYNKYFEE